MTATSTSDAPGAATMTIGELAPHLAERLRGVRARLDARIAELQQVRRRLDDFEASHRAELDSQSGTDFRAGDPKFNATSRVRTATAGA
jgi:hypothetical protein